MRFQIEEAREQRRYIINVRWGLRRGHVKYGRGQHEMSEDDLFAFSEAITSYRTRT